MNDTIYSGARVCGLNANNQSIHIESSQVPHVSIVDVKGIVCSKSASRSMKMAVTSPGSKRTFARKRARVVFILVGKCGKSERSKDLNRATLGRNEEIREEYGVRS